MVMRNRHDGSGWWEDLPPKVRERISAPGPASRPGEPGTRTAVANLPERQRPPALHWMRELGRLALLFLAVAIANVLFLLVALSFVGSGKIAAPAPFAVPGR